MNDKVIQWLLKGDISIRYQTYRDLIGDDRKQLQDTIEKEGWCHKLLEFQNPDGYWGYSYYQPKWISTHYTILDLRNLCISPECQVISNTLQKAVETEKGDDGGISVSRRTAKSDVCVNGMFLNMASYFKVKESGLKSIIDFLMDEIMEDGGFNCMRNRSGAVHSSLHTTLSTCEGLYEYRKSGYGYRVKEVKRAEERAREFILMHRLFKSDRTGEIINKSFLKMPFSPRWKYDILRSMDYFQYSKTPWDDRMKDAMDFLISKKAKDDRWKVNAKYSGEIYFEMEKAGQPGRWNTLRVLRVLMTYQKNYS